MLVIYGFTAAGRQSIARTYRRPIKSCKGFHIVTLIDYTELWVRAGWGVLANRTETLESKK